MTTTRRTAPRNLTVDSDGTTTTDNGDEPTADRAASGTVADAIEDEEHDELAEERETIGSGVLARGRHDDWNAYDNRPPVFVDRNDGDVALSVAAHAVRGNDPPELFEYGDTVARIDALDNDSVEHLVLVPLDRNAHRDRLEWITRPLRHTKQGIRPGSYNDRILDLTLARLRDVLPPVRFLTESAYIRENGTVCTSAGYDPIGQALVSVVVAGLAVPDLPTPESVATAVALIEEFVQDFPFVDDADRATVYALLLTITGRPLFRLVPLFLISGNGMGCGKNLLAECSVRITAGSWIGTESLSLDQEEQRKALTSLFRQGRPVVLFDEVHVLGGRAIARAITSTTWGDRLLGYSESVRYPNVRTLITLGNNVRVTGDLPRRVALCRIHSELETPWLRTDMHHSNLRGWVDGHRAELLGAVLTLWRFWFLNGRPVSNDAQLGSFEEWAATIGGVLELVGITGFLGNIDALRHEYATDDAEMIEHLIDLWDRFGRDAFSSRQVVNAFADIYDPLESYPPGYTPHGDRGRSAQNLGWAYNRLVNRRFGGHKLIKDGTTDGANRWRVLRVVEPNSDPLSSPPSPSLATRSVNEGEEGERRGTRFGLTKRVSKRPPRPVERPRPSKRPWRRVDIEDDQ